MAQELISQILSPTNATYINGVSSQRLLSKATLESVFQQIIEKNDRGVMDKWVKEDEATHAAQVFVNKVIPARLTPREMGASKNGASYSAHQHYTQTETVGIELLQVLDDVILIPRARQDMIPTDLVSEQLNLFSARLATIINGATSASKLLANYLAGDDANKVSITATDIANKEVALRFMEANSLLDEGDQEHSIDIFPENTRVAVVKVSYRPILKGAGVLVIGGANDAYEILRRGGIDKDTTPTRQEDGYIGEIDGVPCHVISNESLRHASGFMGLPENELKASPFIGYIASSYANARGVSAADRIKVVDDPNGQGVRLQPYVKFGVATWYHKGVVALQSATYNPIASLKAHFPTGVTYKLKGVGSRLYPTGGTWTIGATAFTLASVVANDDWNQDHVVGSVFYVGTTAVDTVAAFETGYAAATYKGDFTIGTSKSTTIADGQFVNALVISDDGSVSIFSKKYEA